MQNRKFTGGTSRRRSVSRQTIQPSPEQRKCRGVTRDELNKIINLQAELNPSRIRLQLSYNPEPTLEFVFVAKISFTSFRPTQLNGKPVHHWDTDEFNSADFNDFHYPPFPLIRSVNGSPANTGTESMPTITKVSDPSNKWEIATSVLERCFCYGQTTTPETRVTIIHLGKSGVLRNENNTNLVARLILSHATYLVHVDGEAEHYTQKVKGGDLDFETTSEELYAQSSIRSMCLKSARYCLTQRYCFKLSLKHFAYEMRNYPCDIHQINLDFGELCVVARLTQHWPNPTFLAIPVHHNRVRSFCSVP
jgi:hypothetical protein